MPIFRFFLLGVVVCRGVFLLPSAIRGQRRQNFSNLRLARRLEFWLWVTGIVLLAIAASGILGWAVVYSLL